MPKKSANSDLPSMSLKERGIRIPKFSSLIQGLLTKLFKLLESQIHVEHQGNNYLSTDVSSNIPKIASTHLISWNKSSLNANYQTPRSILKISNEIQYLKNY